MACRCGKWFVLFALLCSFSQLTYAYKISLYPFDAHKGKSVCCMGCVSSSNLFLVSKPSNGGFCRAKAETAAECEDCGTANWPCGWAEGPVCFLCVAVWAMSYLVETDD